MTTGIRKEDIADRDIYDADELSTNGTSAYIENISVVATATTTRYVTLANVDLIFDKDERAEPGDVLILTGTSEGAADGTYHVDTVIDQTTVKVLEPIANATGGIATLLHPPGAQRIGLDVRTYKRITAPNLQNALREIDAHLDYSRIILETNGLIVYSGDGNTCMKSA